MPVIDDPFVLQLIKSFPLCATKGGRERKGKVLGGDDSSDGEGGGGGEWRYGLGERQRERERSEGTIRAVMDMAVVRGGNCCHEGDAHGYFLCRVWRGGKVTVGSDGGGDCQRERGGACRRNKCSIVGTLGWLVC